VWNTKGLVNDAIETHQIEHLVHHFAPQLLTLLAFLFQEVQAVSRSVFRVADQPTFTQFAWCLFLSVHFLHVLLKQQARHHQVQSWFYFDSQVKEGFGFVLVDFHAPTGCSHHLSHWTVAMSTPNTCTAYIRESILELNRLRLGSSDSCLIR